MAKIAKEEKNPSKEKKGGRRKIWHGHNATFAYRLKSTQGLEEIHKPFESILLKLEFKVEFKLD